MPVTGRVIIHRIFEQLKAEGFSVGSEITKKDIRKAAEKLGYFDERTHEKYARAILRSEWVQDESVYEERRNLRPGLEAGPSWSYEKRYQAFAVSPSKRDLSLFSDDELITEKVLVKTKYVVKAFP